MDRRTFLASAGALVACASRSTKPAVRPAAPRPSAATPTSASASVAPAPPSSAGSTAVPLERTLEVLDWTFPGDLGERRAVVLVPRPLPPDAELPVLVALHGLGETTDPLTGANGWPKTYGLERTFLRMYAPPLYPDDLQNLVTSERLTELNDALAQRPFEGMIVACPYLPKDIGGGTPVELYARWLGERLLPRIRAELPARDDVASTGIDGVSLGGWAALRLAAARPDLFGAVGALQPAILDAAMVEWAAALVAQKLAGRPLRIVTSIDDLYRAPLVDLDQRLTQRGIAHEFAITVGPHDYPWNRGPGGVEMLWWHDRALRGERGA
jgi:enterochelin esterase-like enzyme